MGKETARVRRRTTGRSTGSERATKTRTRSFSCPDVLWDAVEHFGAERALGSAAAAVRLLLRSGLSVELRVRELETARDWQIAQAWSDLQAIADGDRNFGSWDEIEHAAERARLQIREREAAAARAAMNA